MGFDILCSKGTYIRSFARDMGKVSGCGAHLSALRRTASGAFKLDQCWSIEDFEARISALPAPFQHRVDAYKLPFFEKLEPRRGFD